MLTIDDVIGRFDGSLAYSTNSKEICQYIADLLKELKERRKAPEIIRCCECDYWKSGMKYCTHPNGMNSDLDNGFCSMAERRNDD